MALIPKNKSWCGFCGCLQTKSEKNICPDCKHRMRFAGRSRKR